MTGERRIFVWLNVAALFAICIVLLAAFAFQFGRHELPCPLCILQRIGFAALAVGPILNLRYGARPGHYAITLLAAVAGAGVAMRQVLLHIAPGDPGYGTPFLGFHYYTWAFILFSLAIVLSSFALLFEEQFDRALQAAPLPGMAAVSVWLVIVLTAANFLNVFVECGFSQCPDNPVRYDLLG